MQVFICSWNVCILELFPSPALQFFQAFCTYFHRQQIRNDIFLSIVQALLGLCYAVRVRTCDTCHRSSPLSFLFLLSSFALACRNQSSLLSAVYSNQSIEILDVYNVPCRRGISRHIGRHFELPPPSDIRSY